MNLKTLLLFPLLLFFAGPSHAQTGRKTDHGRGANPKEQWRGHGKDHEGSDAVWLAVLGPDTPALGEIKTKAQLWQNQIARTAAALLGLDYENKEGEVGESIRTAFEK